MENDKDVKTLLDSYTASFAKEAELFRKYYQKFLEILPPKKVVRLYITEEQFKQMLLRSIRYQ
jgi:CRISPR/Cas system-associated protein endoribonuclease Cas2